MATTASSELGRISRVDALIEAVGPLTGLRLVDIGCGEGHFARMLAGRGAVVQGYDPFIAPRDWELEGPGRFRLSNATADAIPEPDGMADMVLFFLSLHHVPTAMMARALAEAKRLLKPDGVLCVIEPLAEGPGQYVGELFHDETVVRRTALEALAAYASPAFPSERVLYFSEMRIFANWDAYAAQAIGNMRFNGYSEAEVLNPEVRRRFEEMQSLHGQDFEQRFRMNLFGAAHAIQGERALV
jgi:ubiquinone/menaquinone biosynthesis C-methylase UbiE